MAKNNWRVLVTNDDGVCAPGLHALVEAAAAQLGEVTVVAPDREQSGASHALTIRQPVRMEQLRAGWFQVEGTPTDCVNLGFFQVLDRPPDLVLAGVNQGYNLGEDVTYSGTVAGALEGRILGAPSLAISTSPRATPDDFRFAARVAVRLAELVLTRGLPLDAFLNVNAPPGAKGYRITRQGRRSTREGFQQGRDPKGKDYYWVGLAPASWAHAPEADHTAVAEGFISVTPLHADLTFHRALPLLTEWRLEEGGVP